MGRHYRPARVYQAATALFENHRISRKPTWYDVVGGLPPAQTLVRTQPIPHQQRKNLRGTKKASKLFQPQKMTYEEDMLRREFYKDHPWELARPRMLIEDGGADVYASDWSQLMQMNRPLDGESVVQRQLWLLQNNPSLKRSEAYDQVRKEFYDLRLQEDIERRVAREEAMSTGARFGKSAIDIGTELEDQAFEDWKRWAIKEAEAINQRRAAMYTGFDNEAMAVGSDAGELQAAVEEVSDSIPAQGQSAAGGAFVRP